MTHEQAKALIKAADALPDVLGIGWTFYDGKPCCAIGHLAIAAGAAPLMGNLPSRCYGETYVQHAFDLHVNAIEDANDAYADPAVRRAAVRDVIHKQVRSAGHDPAVLRAEIAAEGGAADA